MLKNKTTIVKTRTWNKWIQKNELEMVIENGDPKRTEDMNQTRKTRGTRFHCLKIVPDQQLRDMRHKEGICSLLV
jgi:hypothetical protein